MADTHHSNQYFFNWLYEVQTNIVQVRNSYKNEFKFCKSLLEKDFEFTICKQKALLIFYNN